VNGCALVTGASGFVGRAAVAALLGRGYEVHGVARSPAGDVEVDAWHAADLLDPTDLEALVRDAGATHLLHLAWATEHGQYRSDPANLAWIGSTCRLVEAFVEAGGTRAVMAGSCAQYDWREAGTGPGSALSEAETPRRPATLYGRAKQETTDRLDPWSKEAGLSYATGLLFSPYGPFEKTERLVPSVTNNLLAGEAAATTAGNQVRDFIHVDDCGAALAALLDGDVTGPVNIGSGEGSSVADVAGAIARIVGRENLLRLGAVASGEDSSRVIAATTRLREEVDFSPTYDLETGLRNTVEWWRQRRRRR
jgi:nucleoside-diphosphate-sugar epimerase